jgi:soluble lytic murein transglycosylase-like protein
MQKAEGRRQKEETAAARLMSVSAFCLLLFAFASDASAEILVLTNGRTMSVKSYRTVGDVGIVELRDGGEVSFPASIVARVDPDEVPYPEPAAGSRPFDKLRAAPSNVEGREPAAGIGEPGSGNPELGSGKARVSEEILSSRPFADLISTTAAAHDLDARLIHAVVEQESNYEPRARSKKGARGLMQLMPDTARQYGVRNFYDPKANLDAGVRHLKDLMSRLDLPAALAAYNAGEATVRRYGGLPPFPETQTYVRNILRRLGRQAQ